MEGGEDMGKVVGEENEGCFQMPELSPRRSERVGWKRKSPRKKHVEEMAGGGGEGDHIGEEEENKHTDQFDSPVKPIKVFCRKERPRKIQVVQVLMHEEQGEGENAGNNEELLLNQELHQLPKTSMELVPSRKRSRKGKEVTESREKEEVSQPKTELPMTLSEGISSPQVAIALESRRITRSLKAYLDQSPVRSALLKSPVQNVKNTSADMHDQLTTMGDISASKSSSGYMKKWEISTAEIAFASESRCLTRNMKAYLDRSPARATPLKSPIRNVMSTATDKQDHSARICDMPAAVSSFNQVKNQGISSPQVTLALESRRITRSLKAYLDQSPVRSALLKSPVQDAKNTSADMNDQLTTMGDISASKSSSGHMKKWGISTAEIAFASESRCLTQNMKAYLDRSPVKATSLNSPIRNVMSTATNKQEHSTTICDIPAAGSSSNHVKNQGLSFSPTSLMCHNLHTTALPSEIENQNASVLTKLGDQSMSAEHGLLDTNEHAADLLTQKHGSEDYCLPNPSVIEFTVDNHQPAEEAHMPSNVTINTDKETASKSKQIGACPSRSVSLNLTQVCSLMDDDDLDEVGSKLDEALVSVNGYEVKVEVAPILRDIFFRHGDIAKDCTFRAVKSRSCLLENVCGIYKRMEEANFMLITPIELNSLMEEVRDLETAKIELGWLHCRLVEILEAKKRFKSLKEGKRRITEATEREKQVLDGYKKELEALLKKIHEKENALNVLEVEEVKLHEKFNDMKSNLKGFYRKSLVHGLL